jgi:hypothetical protein
MNPEGAVAAACTVTVQLAVLVLSATLVAWMRWDPLTAGAVYVAVVPLPTRVPTTAVPFVIPSTAQVKAVFVDPETVAVTDKVDPAVNVVGPGLRAMLTKAAAWTVMAE